MTIISHLLLVFNSSSNIVIYCWKDDKFRKVFLEILIVETRSLIKGAEATPSL